MKNDDAYNNRGYIPNGEAYPDAWAQAARAHREQEATLGRARLNESYGSHPREKLDLFHPRGAARGLVIFVHGGFWRLFDRDYWSHFSTGPTERDWAVALPSYPLAPEVRIADITRSIGRAIRRAAALQGGPIVLCGHSAGGHLVTRMACADADLPPEITDRIRRIVPISPVSDLRPLIETSMNDDFRLSEDSARAESPALLEKALDVPVSVWVGTQERPAFIDQARWLAEAWPDAELILSEGHHHFSVIDALRVPDSPLVENLLT